MGGGDVRVLLQALNREVVVFTGIVTACGRVTEANHVDGVTRLAVSVPDGYTRGLERGASVAVNGVCLTAVEFDDRHIEFDVIAESLQRSNLSALGVDSAVNLERAARFGDEIGGHLLSGHVHTQAELIKRTEDGANVSMQLQIDSEWARYVVTKGYIAIDGCSLTVGEVQDGRFWIHLIPETLRVTQLDGRTLGDRLNIEVDHQTQVIVDTVERYLSTRDISK